MPTAPGRGRVARAHRAPRASSSTRACSTTPKLQFLGDVFATPDLAAAAQRLQHRRRHPAARRLRARARRPAARGSSRGASSAAPQRSPPDVPGGAVRSAGAALLRRARPVLPRHRPRLRRPAAAGLRPLRHALGDRRGPAARPAARRSCSARCSARWSTGSAGAPAPSSPTSCAALAFLVVMTADSLPVMIAGALRRRHRHRAVHPRRAGRAPAPGRRRRAHAPPRWACTARSTTSA